uniref:Uncharacterized protein n=1 Tax=Physcomitrium patens TaxID=3218 RepID=A0A2K1IAD1_PHYPA|nr:hypothetical protein PHYPA_030804 [Physcomitrium patens]
MNSLGHIYMYYHSVQFHAHIMSPRSLFNLSHNGPFSYRHKDETWGRVPAHEGELLSLLHRMVTKSGTSTYKKELLTSR